MENEEKEFYLLRTELPDYKRALKSAKTIIQEGLDVMKSPYVSMSFGKDSIVMTHLLLSVKEIPVIYVNSGAFDEWPDTPRVKREFLNRFPCDFIEVKAQSIIDAFRKSRLFIQSEEETQIAKKAHNEYNKSFTKALDGTAKRKGFDGSFIGMRKEESNNRQRLFNMRGSLYYAETRKLWCCCPLAYWTGKDIWSYIVKYNLPYNELYNLDPLGRELARNGAMIGTRSARYGRIVRFARMYPEIFNRFASEFPEVRNFT